MNHKELYAKIPSFHCRPNCNDCCTVMQEFDEWELDQVKDKRFPQGLECPYKEKGCAIYKQRPFICRLYGSSESAPCKYGFGPKKPLTAEETNQLIKEYRHADSE